MATVVATVFGLSVATAGSAAAATGEWRAYGNTNPITSSSSTWHCNLTVIIATDVSAQVCAIRSASKTSVQGAVIVRNNTSSLFSASALIYVYNAHGFPQGEWQCPSSGVGANSWSVCFGQSFTFENVVRAYGKANTSPLGFSPYV
ncbi:hypothetical protein ACFQV2_30915 [Actinokineospora soli]|uniref:Uncharacterized protein n=1 Tax=Actinokineospora soli TaxID=1048753 RepID=A0ABW2TVD5_9PSEU